MKSVSKLVLALTFGISAAPFAFANDEHGGHGAHHMADASQAAGMPAAQTADSSDSRSEGEVKKVDKDAGKLTIKHGPLKNLDMPPMTMVFRVKDPAMLEQVKTGDKISFVADKVNGQYVVTEVEAKK